MTIPYETATAGRRARDEIDKTLIRLGSGKIAHGEDLEKHEIWVQFEHRGRMFHIPQSAKCWAQPWLRKNPWSYSRRKTRADYEQNALKQGQLAAESILCDLIKSQVTMIESGLLSVEAVFMGLHADSGWPPADRSVG